MKRELLYKIEKCISKALMLLIMVFFRCVEINAQCIEEITEFPFYHGVASGDATSSEVIIWTQVTPIDPQQDVEVIWSMATDPGMQNEVGAGSVFTGAQRDFTVKVDVGNLEPDQWYYYRFESLGVLSMIGRTHTLPTLASEFSFVAFSCSNYERGYFNYYHDAAEHNHVQAVVHVGDYYYEYSSGELVPGRLHNPPHMLYSLDDYRTRHAQVCSDRDAQELRRQYPWYTIWDDHEFANDAWIGGAPAHDTTICSWEQRKNAARQAYFEWMPIREFPDNHIYRKFQVGDLASFHFLDTRMESRMEQVSSASTLVDDSTRTLIGEQQLQWLEDELVLEPDSMWKFMFNSVMMTKATNTTGQPIDSDTWEGYRYERSKLWNFLDEQNIENCVSIAGDYHSSWASNLPLENYDDVNHLGSVGCELAVCAGSSSPHTVGDIPTFMGINPHVKWIEQTRNGYLLCTISRHQVVTQWKYVSTNLSESFTIDEGQRVMIERGNPYVQLVDGNLYPTINSAAKAPNVPWVQRVEQIPPATGLNGVMIFPNPASGPFHLYWYGECGRVDWQIFNMQGQLMRASNFILSEAGQHYTAIDPGALSAGVYMLHLKNGNDETLELLEVISNRK